MKIAAISSRKVGDSYEGKLKNNYLYNGKELLDEDADLGWLDYGFRNYDPQIGRFPQLDPLTDSYPFLTPYQYASCDPITNIDIDGLEGGSAVGGTMGHIGRGLLEAAENGGKVKDITGIVVRASYNISNAKKIIPIVSLTRTILQTAQIGISMINSNTITTQAGNNGTIVMSNQRYNHHSGQYLTTTNSSEKSRVVRNKSSSGNRWGQIYASEFGGGNNAPHGQTDEPRIKADLLMALLSSWMGGDPELAKNWLEIVEKVPDILMKGNEMVETYKNLKEKKKLEDYIKRVYEEQNNSGGGGNPDMAPASQINPPIKYSEQPIPNKSYRTGKPVHCRGCGGNRQYNKKGKYWEIAGPAKDTMEGKDHNN